MGCCQLFSLHVDLGLTGSESKVVSPSYREYDARIVVLQSTWEEAVYIWEMQHDVATQARPEALEPAAASSSRQQPQHPYSAAAASNGQQPQQPDCKLVQPLLR